MEVDFPPYIEGRCFSETRRVGLSDVDPAGRLRVDALAGYLQDVAANDVEDAGVADLVAWVVRRTTIAVEDAPRFGRDVELTTWCSGLGPSLAERRTTLRTQSGVAAEAVSLWVSLDPETMRPAPVPDFEPYAEAAGGRKVRSRFLLPAQPAGTSRPWHQRFSDLDPLGHVNNTIAWTALLDTARAPVSWGQVEYRVPISPGDDVTLVHDAGAGKLSLWLLGPGGRAAVAAEARI